MVILAMLTKTDQPEFGGFQALIATSPRPPGLHLIGIYDFPIPPPRKYPSYHRRHGIFVSLPGILLLLGEKAGMRAGVSSARRH